MPYYESNTIPNTIEPRDNSTTKNVGNKYAVHNYFKDNYPDYKQTLDKLIQNGSSGNELMNEWYQNDIRSQVENNSAFVQEHEMARPTYDEIVKYELGR